MQHPKFPDSSPAIHPHAFAPPPAGGPLPLALFDYDLPKERIAQAPISPRDASRLMLLRGTEAPSDCRFVDLPDLLEPGDLLVVNRTKVIAARLRVTRSTGGRVELLFSEPVAGNRTDAQAWRALAKPAKSLRPGDRLRTALGATLTVLGREDAYVLCEAEGPLLALLDREGELPLPPYLARAEGPTAADENAYQTVFAQEPGAVAAPTASLHFTPAVEARLAARGIERADVLLHVGPGTFLPVRPEHEADARAHRMHGEHFEVPEATWAKVQRTREAGRRVVAVGTTSLRALETAAARGALRGTSDLFVTPGFPFQCVDALLTNFHLPKSTLMMLVSALAGRERILSAYAAAVAAEYRFFSFGDAMLILDPPYGAAAQTEPVARGNLGDGPTPT